jgi:hypothetical protein
MKKKIKNIFKSKSLKVFGLIIALIIVGGLASFQVNVSFKPNTASATSVTCSDGASSCGTFDDLPLGNVFCNIHAKMNQPFTVTCNTADNTTVVGGPGQQAYGVLSKSGSVVVPSTYTDSTGYYNGGAITPNSSVSVSWGASHAGSVSIGTVSDTYDPCSPFAIGKKGNPGSNGTFNMSGGQALVCDGFSNRTDTGTVSPGDALNMTVTLLGANNNMNSSCDPTQGGCDYGSGVASASITNLTYCYKSTSSGNTNYIVPGDPTSGKRNYVPDPNNPGTCMPNNLPAAVPALSAKWNANGLTHYTAALTPGQKTITIPFTFWNSGQPESIANVTGCTAIPSNGVSVVGLPSCPPTTLTAPKK